MDPFVNAAMVLADPKGITPDYSYFPFMATLNKIAAGFEGMALIICVILLVAAAILFGASKLTSSPAARVTGTVFIVCIVLAAVIAGAGGLISWATGIPLV